MVAANTIFSIQTGLVTKVCGECYIAFAIPQEKENRCLESGESWHCPNGHCRIYTKSDNAKLKEKLARVEADKDYYRNRTDELYNQKTHLERRVAATKGQVTKIKNRVGRGVCPCCNRTFQNLGQHMHNQHPEWLPEGA